MAVSGSRPRRGAGAIRRNFGPDKMACVAATHDTSTTPESLAKTAPSSPAATATHPPAPAAASPSDAPELAVWEYAGLMLTYWCNAKCAFCYVYSGPDRGGCMSVADALTYWRGLREVAAAGGKSMRVHLSGGEPFGDWPHLLAVAQAAHAEGLTTDGGFEKVETNAYWARDDGETRERLSALRACGMEMLVISADVYHQEFVPMERVERCVRVAREVLGEKKVRVRWWDFTAAPVDLRGVDEATKRAAFAEALSRHRERLTGRAADELCDFYPGLPAESFADDVCVKPVLQSKHVHIDPYGNVFPGVCSGIILGNAAREPLPAMWRRLRESWREHAVVGPVVGGSSTALYHDAVKLGYVPRPQGYANKCHLCTHVRQFLHERGDWSATVGPGDCYAKGATTAPVAIGIS